MFYVEEQYLLERGFCKHYREKFITLLPAGNMTPLGRQGCFRSSRNPVGLFVFTYLLSSY